MTSDPTRGSDLSGGAGVTDGGGVQAVQNRSVVVLVQSLYGHHDPRHQVGIVWRKRKRRRRKRRKRRKRGLNLHRTTG